MNKEFDKLKEFVASTMNNFAPKVKFSIITMEMNTATNLSKNTLRTEA